MGIELRRRGVADDVIESVLRAEYPPVEEHRVAREVAEARFRRLSREADPTVRTRRLIDYLTRRGFSRGLAFDLARELEAEEGGR